MKDLIISAQYRLTYYFRILLFKIYKFDKWHVSPLMDRRYAQDLIVYLNSRKERYKFLEVGCGLGDILRNVKYKYRLGLDIEQEVLSAARLISIFQLKRGIGFRKFIFPIDSINGKFDVILLVNWIHNIEPYIIKEKVSEYFHQNLSVHGLIIIDSVNHNGYKYYHKVQEIIIGLDCSIEKIGSYECNRELWAIKKI